MTPPQELPLNPAAENPSPGRVLRFTRTLLATGTLLAVGVILWKERETAVRALSMSASDLALISGFTIVSWMVNTVAHRLMLGAMGAHLSFPRLFGLHMAAGLLNHLPMRVGTMFRAHYLKRHAQLDYVRFGSFMLINVLIMSAASGLVGASTVLAFYGWHTSETRSLVLGFVVVCIAALIPLTIQLPRATDEGRIRRFYNRIIQGRSEVLHHPRMILILFCLHGLVFLFGAIRFWGAFHALDIDLAFPGCIVLGALSVLSILVGLTPGALGVHELLVGAGAALLGVPWTTAVVGATTVRAVLFLCYAVLGLPSVVLLRREPDIQEVS